jgi:hypothetical protein
VRSLQIALATLAASAVGGPKIVLSSSMPGVIRIGQTVTIAGHLRHGDTADRAVLQTRRPRHSWTTIARGHRLGNGRFTIGWKVPASEKTGPILLRVAALKDGRPIAHTRAKQAVVGPVPVYCAPPVPPAVDIPVGDGWIEGGLYLEGGPFPGILQCEQQAYTIEADTSSGAVVASQHVAGGHSYTLVVPAGTYTLRSGGCGFGSATVTAGDGTTANTYCPVP